MRKRRKYHREFKQIAIALGKHQQKKVLSIELQAIIA